MLRILSVRKSDSGEYTVLLTNKKGSEKSSAKVVVTSDGKLRRKTQEFHCHLHFEFFRKRSSFCNAGLQVLTQLKMQ